MNTGGSRRIGKSEVALSPLTLGTMRLDRVAEVPELLEHALELGITSFHCSAEYPTFPAFRDAWRQVGASTGSDACIIAKVAAPHFGEDRFSAEAFRSKVQFYLDELALEKLHVVQWLLRYDLDKEAARLRIMDDAGEEIAAVIGELKERGLIGACVGFPYSGSMAERLIRTDCIDGLALYVNPLEREMEPFIRTAADAGKSTLAIRPFAAGRVFEEIGLTARDALDHVFSFPAIATAIVSASTPAHLDDLRAHLTTSSGAGSIADSELAAR